MALQIIGSGFGRTGTRSLWEALGMIGYSPCHHMEEVFEHPAQVLYWQDYAAGKSVDWKKFFEDYKAQVDWPGCHIWRELADLYPDAKVLHSERPEEAWWASFSNTIGKLLDRFRTLPIPPHIHDMLEAVETSIIRPTFGVSSGPIDKEHAIAGYRKRRADVVAAIPPERLLVFDVSQGWEPLCRFLNVAVPDVPFPRTNNRADFWTNLGGEPA